jgi:hypothetical protein
MAGRAAEGGERLDVGGEIEHGGLQGEHLIRCFEDNACLRRAKARVDTSEWPKGEPVLRSRL